ncbi:zinc-binding alcohol dehydrogenase family protein [Kribbella sp. NPDC048928]|uniref:quinone oxidoreductase family protein n=1 Tax=Kribbella sp. NPDC048928 TaxID=3364111 RepID=UPI003715697C
MRAVRFHRHGGPDVLQLDEVAVPEPGSGQVLIEAEAIGANAIDTVLRRGGSPWDRPLPGTLTGEVVGRIAALGPDAPPGIAIGQRVVALAEDAFADQSIAEADFLARIPDDADAAEATMMAMTGPLAYRLLETAHLPAGGAVVIHSAAGTIGHLAVQLARSYGLGTVIGTASSPHRLDFIRSLGVEAVDLTDPDWPAKVRELAPDGVDAVLDAVGGKVFEQGLDLIKPLGSMITYGAITTELPTVPAGALFGFRSVTGVSIMGWRGARPEAAHADIAEVVRRWQSGELRPVVAATHPLAEVTRIHEALDARSSLGRLVATP